MDVPGVLRGPLIFKTFREKLQRYRRRNFLAQSAPSKIKLYRGGTTLIAALALAWLTNSAVGEQSVQDYLTNQWPNPDMWQGYLRQRGYLLINDSAMQSKLLQQFVPIFESEASIFVSEDSCLIYLEAAPHNGGHSELWTCQPKPTRPRRWNRLGTGWLAFQKLPKSPQNWPKPSKQLSNSIDPKEIRY